MRTQTQALLFFVDSLPQPIYNGLMPTVSAQAVDQVRRTLETQLFQWLLEKNYLVVTPARQYEAEIYLKSLQAAARARGERSLEWFLPYVIVVNGTSFRGLILDPQADVDFS